MYPLNACISIDFNTMKKTLLIDNYDSFTYNLYQFLGELGAHPIVFRNNEITLEDIKNLEPTHIVISPGPGTVEHTEDFGICQEVIKKIGEQGIRGTTIPILGVCLGHQGIINIYGGEIAEAPEIVHGKRSRIHLIEESPLFKHIPQDFESMRYHSLIGRIEGTKALKKLKITAVLKDNPEIIMAVEHREHPIYGIQFHPESIGTPEGKKILRNFLNLTE